ncbi:MAG: cyclophilin-like fold protein [Eubacteriales bacterium]|nr:cyclophilin-like fold protein [Eubacteriales bacterium]
MKKRLFAILTVLTLAVSSTAYAADPLTGFSDIPEGAPYAQAVKYCRDNGLMNGTSATEFSPEESTSRAMLVTILYRQQTASVSDTAANAFADVASNAWYYDAVRWGAANGLVSGIDATHFAPEDLLTREQILTILWRAAESPAADVAALPYTDANAISSYARTAAAWAYENGIVGTETGTALWPKAPVTRAELAQTLYNFLNAPTAQPAPDGTPDIHVTVGDVSFDVVLYDSATTRLLMTQVPETDMMLPTSYDLNGVCKYYDIPMSYHDALQIAAEPVTSVKAGDLLLDDSNRLYLYYQDSAVSGDYLRVGYVADTTDLQTKLGSGSVTFYVTQY